MPTSEYQPPPADTVDLVQLAGLITQRRRFIVLCAAVMFSLVMVITMFSSVKFSASSRMYLGELSSTTTAGGEEAELGPTSNSDIGSEVEILSSRSLVSKAVLLAGINAPIKYLGESSTPYWRWRVSKRDPELFDAALRKVRPTNTDFVTRTRDPVTFLLRFTARDSFQVALPETTDALATGRLGEPLIVNDARIQLLKGEHSPEAGDEFELTIVPTTQAVESVLNRLTVASAKATGTAKPNVVSLNYEDHSPMMAAEFLHALMSVYMGERQEWKTQDASAAEEFVTSQLVSLRASLDASQRKLAEFRANNRVVVLNGEAQAMISQISRYEEQRVASRLEAEALADVERALKSANPAPEAFMLGEAQDSVLSGLASSLSESRRRLAELETRFSAEAPDVVNQRAQIKAQLDTIRSYVSNRLSRARDNLGTLGGVIGKYEQKLRTVPGAELELAQLTRESEVYDAMYAFLLKRQQQAAITKASTVSKNRILDLPEVPFFESAPKLGMRLGSAPLGLLLGIVIVLTGSFFSRTYQSSSDVHGSLGSTPVFATLPQGLPNSKRLRSAEQASMDVWQQQVSFGFLEAFRTLRTNIYLAAPAQSLEGRVVLVTSPSPGDGKTTSALSLAWILAADGKKVLVIDADLRKPSHFQMAGLPQTGPTTKDLRAVLSGECSWQEAAISVQGARSIQSLGVSEAAPAELLSGHNLKLLLNQARRECDYIILDSPSYPLVSDALVMAPTADIVLSVIRPEHTPRRLTTAHVERMRDASNVYAVIVNDSHRQDIYGSAYPGTRSNSGVRAMSMPPPA